MNSKMLRSLKGQRTKLFKKIQEELEKTKEMLDKPVNEPKDADEVENQTEISQAVLTAFKDKFEGLSEKITANSEEQDEKDSDDEDEFVIDVTTDITRRIAELSTYKARMDRKSTTKAPITENHNGLDKIQRKIDKLVELQELQLSAPNLSSTVVSENNEIRPSHSVRLPTIELEKFSGNVLKFQEFWDSFSVAIDTNPTLRPVEKLNYLRMYLCGDARQVISGVSTCDNNYQVAVDLVRKRFGNPQSSIDAHYKSITTLQPVSNYTPRVRGLFDQIEKHLRCLEALGEDVEHRHFISLIMTKLPREVVVHLEQSKPDEEPWSVLKLRNNLQHFLNARESAERQQTTTERHPPDAGKQQHDSHNSQQYKRWTGKAPPFSQDWQHGTGSGPNTTQGLVAYDRSSSRRQLVCIFCKGNHFNDECNKFRTAWERRRALRGCCFVCLRNDHSASNCQSTRPCYYCKQVQRHNRCLCPQRFGGTTEATAISAEDTQAYTADDQHCSNRLPAQSSEVSFLATGDRVLLQTAMVDVNNTDNSAQVTTRVLLDCASNRSYVSSELAERLKLRSRSSETISVVTFGSEKPKTVQTTTAKLQVRLKDGTKRYIDVNVVPKITGLISRAPVKFPKSQFLWKGLPLADTFPENTENSPIDFLIGNDYYLEFVTGEKIEVGDGLFLLGSSFGWLLTGRVENDKSKEEAFSMFINSRVNHSISEISSFSSLEENLPIKPSFQDYWKLDSIGVTDDPEVNDDDKAIEQFNSSVQFTNHRYFVSWPWRDDASELPENYQLAYGRFISLLKKFKDNPTLFQKYREVIDDQEQKGIVERVNDEHRDQLAKHYIPHHAVVTPTKTTTKVRIVYDASAKTHKKTKSLNECLLRGPIILEDLCGLLLRFRLFPVAMISDIEKAFLQIGLHEKDKDVTRFFWLKDPNQPSLFNNNLQIYRFCRVPFGAISSPFLLAATVKHHLLKCNSSTAVKIISNLYVDNLVTGTNSIEEALDFYKESKTLFKQASMNLREWTSNVKAFNDQLPEEDKVKSTTSSVLGLQWNTTNDSLCVKSAPIAKMESAITKRQLFQSLASVFDPLGFFTPITLRGKLYIHKLWTQSLTWDDRVCQQDLEEWKSLANELAQVTNYKIPRFIGHSQKEVKSVELICFCDASAQAYATVVYAKPSVNGTNISLLFAKSRLAPSKTITIPRMELLGVLIGVRCLNFVEKQIRLPVSSKILWTDSQCVLHWINSQKQQQVFIENRLKEIKKVRDIDFRYVIGKDNPADIATRGEYSLHELKNSIWWNGPVWLSKDQQFWPHWAYNHSSKSTDDGEDITSKEISMVSESSPVPSPYNIDSKRFSSLTRLYRVSAWVQRFIDKLRKRFKGQEELSSNELSLVRNKWDCYVQRKHFPEIFKAIHNNKRCNLKEQLNIQQDEKGLLHCHGRFRHANIPESQRSPILLPRSDHYSSLVIQSIHRSLLHSGISHTLSQLRLDYWIPQGRSAVRRLLSQCTVCRRHSGGPYKIPDMPPWPSSRVSRNLPFSYAGVDYLGPLYVKSNTPDSAKVWICLFTCMSVRAIHLEVVEDLSASQFLLGLRRFIARRGKPTQIVSDNATQFKLSKNVIERLWAAVITDPDITSYISVRGIEWRFITEAAPWMGGFYERLIGVVKSSLKKSIGKQRLTLSQLQTVVTEVEAVINSRPIVNKGETPEDVRCISPSSFLSLSDNDGVPIINNDDATDPPFVTKQTPAELLLNSWKKGHRILDQFWSLWKDDYLASLRERSSFRHNQHRVLCPLTPSIGDIVLIGDNNLPRGSWRLARIQKLLPSYDNVIRAAQVKFASGNITNRPLKLMYPLECSNVKGNSSGKSTKDTEKDTTAVNPPAAIKESQAHDKILKANNEQGFQITKQSPSRNLPKRDAAVHAARVLKKLAKEGQL